MLAAAKRKLRALGDAKRGKSSRTFFKNCGDDLFLGVPAQQIRLLAREFEKLSLLDVRALMHSSVHEERSLAHGILRRKFDAADERGQKSLFSFYLKNRSAIRDWDGVDDSAPYIVGPYLLERDKKILYHLVRSKNVWDRRIAIVSTWWFIRNDSTGHTFALAELLLKDEHDLIHKAAGWMLREAGKRELASLRRFLKKHGPRMPRTMLRYAIERFPERERKRYLSL